MRIKGEIYKKRSYKSSGLYHSTYITFIRVHQGIMINGENIIIIPILSDEMHRYEVGEHIDLNGRIEFKRIITSTGDLSFLPVPVIIPEGEIPINKCVKFDEHKNVV
ncbi:hypothetical protein LIT25_28110 (plasmid) [Bacillus sp. F19]|nr:hypothetical protein LIT25_28110 [Bacillus sp. F19]